jgi:hypothetical protein
MTNEEDFDFDDFISDEDIEYIKQDWRLKNGNNNKTI